MKHEHNDGILTVTRHTINKETLMNPQNQDQPVNPNLDNDASAPDTATPVTPAPAAPTPDLSNSDVETATLQTIENLESENTEPTPVAAPATGTEAVAGATDALPVTEPASVATPATGAPTDAQAAPTPLETSAAGVAAAVGAQAAQQQQNAPVSTQNPASQPAAPAEGKKSNKLVVVALVVVLVLVLAVAGYFLWQSTNTGA